MNVRYEVWLWNRTAQCGQSGQRWMTKQDGCCPDNLASALAAVMHSDKCKISQKLFFLTFIYVLSHNCHLNGSFWIVKDFTSSTPCLDHTGSFNTTPTMRCYELFTSNVLNELPSRCVCCVKEGEYAPPLERSFKSTINTAIQQPSSAKNEGNEAKCKEEGGGCASQNVLEQWARLCSVPKCSANHVHKNIKMDT